MKQIKRPALIASFTATLVVVASGFTGLMSSLEEESVDLRFAHGRWRSAPLDEHLALVTIDDGSVDDIGRFPWTRSTTAQFVSEIARAGAKVIAFDFMWDDRESDAADGALAAAIASGNCVLGVNVDPQQLLGEVWLSPEGNAALEKILAALERRVDQTPEQVLAETGVGAPWAERFKERAFRFKDLAVWRRLRSLAEEGKSPATLQEFIDLMAGGPNPERNAFPEQGVLTRAFEREQAWQALRRFCVPPPRQGTVKEVPPLRIFCDAAAGAGTVYGTPDSDGETRRVQPGLATSHGLLLQLGVASAVTWCDGVLARVKITPEAVEACDWRLPLRHGAIYIDWPTVCFDGFAAVAGDGPPRTTIPAGTLVSLARIRSQVAEQEAQFAEVAQEIIGAQGIAAAELKEPPAKPQVRREIEGWVKDNLPGALTMSQDELIAKVKATIPPSDEDPNWAKSISVLMGVRLWDRLDRELPQSRATLAEAEAKFRDLLNGKLVFVGYTGTGAVADKIITPFSPQTPGVFVHAAVASMVLGRHSLGFAPDWCPLAFAIILGGACSLVASRLGAGASTMVVLPLLLAYTGVVVWAFGAYSYSLPLVAPLAAGFLAWVAGMVAVAVVNQLERQRVVRQFRARVSPQLVDRLADNPDAINVSGVQREVTILFGDLAGFTSISESLGGPEVVATLNRYMSAMTRELTTRRAYVNKFLGDGLLAFWSAFGDEPQQRALAVEAAVACQRVVEELGKNPQQGGKPVIKLRLGIATGTVVVGDCGAPPELNDYTVIGDAVNLASRLESANKQFGTRILMDGRTAEGLDGLVTTLKLGRVIVVGQSVPVEVVTVPPEETPAGWSDAVAGGVAAFGRGDAAAARAAWESFEKRFGESKLAHAFLAALDDPAEMKDGVLRLRAK